MVHGFAPTFAWKHLAGHTNDSSSVLLHYPLVLPITVMTSHKPLSTKVHIIGTSTKVESEAIKEKNVHIYMMNIDNTILISKCLPGYRKTNSEHNPLTAHSSDQIYS